MLMGILQTCIGVACGFGVASLFWSKRIQQALDEALAMHKEANRKLLLAKAILEGSEIQGRLQAVNRAAELIKAVTEKEDTGK